MAIYHCINEACGRPFPRQVAFCPFCGMRQAGAPAASGTAPHLAGGVSALPLPVTAATEPEAVAPAPQAPSRAEPPPPEPSPRPEPSPLPESSLAGGPESVPALAQVSASPPMPAPQGESEPTLAKASTEFTALAAPPPLPKPIGKRTWLLVLLALAAIWMLVKPRNQDEQFEARVDQAIAMTGSCKIDEARAELASLKSSKARPEQWRRLQHAISATAPACEKKRLRAKAWSDAAAAAERALSMAAPERAASRLAQFTQRWGEDANTRELADRIGARRAARLLDEAETCLRKADPVCTEERLLIAEGINRPELAQRSMALRQALSRMAEPTLAAPPAPVIAASPPAPAVRARSPAPAVADKRAVPMARPRLPAPVVADRRPVPVVRPRLPVPVIAERRPVPAVRARPPVAVTADRRPVPTVRVKPPASAFASRAPGQAAQAKAPTPVLANKSPAPLVMDRPLVRRSSAPVFAHGAPAPAVRASPPAPIVRQSPVPAASPEPPAPILADTPPMPTLRARPPVLESELPGEIAAAAPQRPPYAGRLLEDARRDLAQGNYKGAIDKLEMCATVIDAGNRKCQALRQKAERLNRDMLRCVASGADWVDDQCQ